MRKHIWYIMILAVVILMTTLGSCAKSTPAGADEQALFEKHRASFEILSDLISKHFQYYQAETNDDNDAIRVNEDSILQLRSNSTGSIQMSDEEVAALNDILRFFSGFDDSTLWIIFVTNNEITFDAGKVVVINSYGEGVPTEYSLNEKIDRNYLFQFDKHWYYTYGGDYGPRAFAWYNDPLYQLILFLLQPVTIIVIVCIIAAIAVLVTVRRKRKKQMKALDDDSKASKP